MAQLGPMMADRWQNWVNLGIMGIWVSEIFYYERDLSVINE